jgi:hypothetical protein
LKRAIALSSRRAIDPLCSRDVAKAELGENVHKTARAVVASQIESPGVSKARAPASGRRARERESARNDAPLARTDLVGKVARERFDEEIDAALKRRPANESKLAGALRAVAPLSPQIRSTLADALRVLLRRRTLDRELYAASVRSLAECNDKNAAGILREALVRLAMEGDDTGGAATLSAAASCSDRELGPLLSKIAASRQSHLAFGAEVARVVRGESNGAHLLSLAPMIKESHRISLCVEIFVPLARAVAAPLAIARPLYVLGEAERHLGRWLVLGEVATKSGDRGALDEAKSRAADGPSSSRAAWSLVAWALSQIAAKSGGDRTGDRGRDPPVVRPTVELVARLSDRPSADRDMTFLFRLAEAKAPSARAMLEALAKPLPLGDETAVRAAMHLARDYGREDLRRELLAVARGQRREDLRGLAAAMLWDAGQYEDARVIADELVTSKCLANVVWASLVRAAAITSHASATPSSASTSRARHHGPRLGAEAHVRWIHLGWLE